MLKIILNLSFIFVLHIGFAQNTFYVATNGDNSNTGTISNPWLTIQYGVNQLNIGDTLLIREGVYEEKIDINVSGSASGYITIKNYENENVVIDAINFSDAIPILWTDNSYLHIEGLHITNNIYNFASGIALQGAAHHINIINNKISNIKFSSDPNAPVTPNTNAVPLSIWADMPLDSIHSIVIRGNEVYNNQTGYSENIAAGGNFSTFVIEDNTVYNNTNIGIDVGGNYQISPNPLYDQGRYGVIRNNIVYNCNSDYSPAAGIYIDGGRDIIVENNICFQNGYGGEIGCEENGSTSNVIFRNNIFYENAYAGMHFGGYDENTTGIVINSSIYNNTFYHNNTNNDGSGELILTNSENCYIENNIFYLSEHNVFLYAYRTQNNLSFDYNLVFADTGSENIETYGNFESVGLQNYYNASGYGENSIFSNPFFINPQEADFHISSTSTAIDIGNPLYEVDINEVDLDGESRIFNTYIDCGADEYHPTAGVDEIFFEKTTTIYPNPSVNYIYIEGVEKNEVITIYNLLGQHIKRQICKNTYIKIDISSLKEGVYFVEVMSVNNKKQVKRIIKTRDQ